MLKKLFENKSQAIMFFMVMAIVVIRNLITLYGKGNPLAPIITFCVLMSVLYVVFYFNKIPSGKDELFTGETLIRIIGALVIFLWIFSSYYVTHDFCLTMVALPIMIFCASDIRFMPLNVVSALALILFGYETAVFATIPWTFMVSFVLTAPKLKNAETWKKLVFAATQICLTADIIYIIYQLRFLFYIETAKSYLLTTIIMAVLAVLFIVCAVLSLRSKKASPARKKKKAVAGKEPEYLPAVGYTIAAVFALLSTLLELRNVAGCIAGILMSLLILCKDSTLVHIFADKAAAALRSIVDKFLPAESAE
ncbi:MAG: hypothetical protein IJE72_05655 [Clostridia bacterium]|nr:hypothetical protein [Clostridia bacterium]